MVSRHVPEAIKRGLKEEAGYRCAVPTCRDKGPFDYEHIRPWAEVQEHSFDNMVLLCVGCHARVTRNEISKDAIRTYKRNLAVLNGRYSLFEVRFLAHHYHAGLKMSDDGSFMTMTMGERPTPTMFTDVDLLHVEGLIKDEFVYLEPMPLKMFSHSIVDKLGSNVPENEARMIASTFGLPQWRIRASPKAINFMDDFFSGRELK